MSQINKSKTFPYSASQIFDLVADVESYPEFLPWCTHTKLVKRDENEIIGTLTVQKGAIKKSFTTKNHFVYPEYMTIHLASGPLKDLKAKWTFTALDDNKCEVSYQMNIDLPFFLKPILGNLLEYMANTMVTCFAKRADEIYGND